MELIERAGFLAVLQQKFRAITDGEGHCVFVSGEAGIGKTSLVKVFCEALKTRSAIYWGTCDALFTPRPLAPLYDILLQMGSELPDSSVDPTDRTAFFTRFFQELSNQSKTTLLVFEDIHWADEATLDFIKFLARRIGQLRCLFLLTYRDDEIHSRHPLRNVLGQLSPDAFTRMQLLPFPQPVVEKMAAEKGVDGSAIYHISGGNPFYVNEILASYSPGIPDNIKDSILSVYHRQPENTQRVWELLSILPTGFRIRYLEKIAPLYGEAIDASLDSKILLLKGDTLYFKHELYRRTIESSLSPLVRVALNKKILDLLLEDVGDNQEIEQIIHHAKNANEYDLVVQYAPLGAGQAASVGAHIEASRLYFSAIEYYQGNDPDVFIRLYESYAYECYLTSQLKEAIIYTGKALNCWKKKGDVEKMGNSMRFLSRLWWFDGNRKQAESYGVQALDTLDKEPSSRAKAMAYSNMSQLKMLSDQSEECIFWGGKAIAMARELGDEETLSHALNNVGTVQMRIQSCQAKGLALLQQSLAIALKNSYHEHAARAYTNLGCNGIVMKDYVFARKALEEGIAYCEERDLDSWLWYMSSWMARLNLQTGHWEDASNQADRLLKNATISTIIKITALGVVGTLKVRRGDLDVLPVLLEAKAIAFEIMELQRIIPALSVLLEYEWITGKSYVEKESLEQAIELMGQSERIFESHEFAFWLRKARGQTVWLTDPYEGYQLDTVPMALKAAALWERAGCPYEQALALFEGGEEDKRKAIMLVHGLGATAVYEKMKRTMRIAGIKSIPRGIRKSTQSNPALLTGRELDVLHLLREGIANKEIAARLFISAKTVDHHISAILFKLEAPSRARAVQEAVKLGILK